MLLSDFQIAAEMAALIHDERVVRNRLFRPALVLRKVVAALLLFDVEKTCRAVIRDDLLTVVVEQPRQFVEVTMPHALGGRFEHQRLLVRLLAIAQDDQCALLACRPVAKDLRTVPIGLTETGVDRLGKPIAVAGQHIRVLNLRDRQQRRIARQRIRCRNPVAQLDRVEAFVLDRVVNREQQSRIGKIDARVDRLQQDSVAVVEDLEIRIVRVDRAREHDERHQRVALIVRPFRVIAVRREQLIELLEEPRLAVTLQPVQRLLHVLPVIEHIARHADGGHRPRTVVVNSVECLGGLHRKEIRHRAQEAALDRRTLLRSERIGDRVVALNGVHQPHRFVQALPEQSARRAGAFDRVPAQRRVELCVCEQQVPRITGVLRISSELVQDSGIVNGNAVLLVLLVRVAAARILRYGHIRRRFEIGVDFRARLRHRPPEARCRIQLGPDERHIVRR